MARRRLTTAKRFRKVLGQEQSAIRRHDFKKAMKLNTRAGKLLRTMEHRKAKRR